MQLKSWKTLGAAALTCGALTFGFAQSQPVHKNEPVRLKGRFAVRVNKNVTQAGINAAAAAQTLPLFTYNVHATRDGKNYTGVIVGRDPFHGGGSGSVTVPTEIVPVVIVTHRIGTAIDANGQIATTPGKTVFNPNTPLPACLNAPNDVPFKLARQSPVFTPTNINFGGTNMGTVQYTDAFQRAEFWQVIDPTTYHLRLGVKTLAPVTLDIPAANGLALATSSLGPPNFCTRLGILDIDVFDNLIVTKVLPKLKAKGVNPATFPIFLMANVVEAGANTQLGSCCILGYHGTNQEGSSVQTYSPSDFDTTGLFGTNGRDIDTLTHEVAEWANDPFGNNPTPAWGHTGQVAGCQGNLEVGDPLSGTGAPRLTTSNSFTYHPQELAFFSWFFRSNSVGVHGWFSDNGTFLHDAGAVCQ